MGGHGNVSVTANVAPRLMADMCRLALAGAADEARDEGVDRIVVDL